MKKALTRAAKVLLFLFPLILGMIGLWALAGESFQDALFSCVSMYVLNYGDEPPNLLVELARWLAPLTTASQILMALRAIRNQVLGLVRYLMGNGVAVYGPEAERAQVAEKLGSRGIQGTDKVIPARQYILLGNDGDSFELCRRILQQRPDADVFLRCPDVQPQSVASPRLHLFSPEETAARLFWKEHCLYLCSREHGHKLKIVLLGFGTLGENLLYCGLLDNIFAPGQRIEYHVFGGGGRFSAVHTQLGQIDDPVRFHEEPWWDDLDLLNSAQLVLLLPQKDQASIARDLLLAVRGPRLMAFPGDPTAALLAETGGLELFPWLERALEPENILQDTLFAQAKQINLRYAKLYGGVEENDKNREAEWDKLDAFTRYSNISCADYHEIRLKMLEEMGLPADAGLPAATMELLAELEHIRWCRYHYLNNWRRGSGKDGRKDPKARLHPDLIPYGELADKPDKEKDRENIRVLMGIK